MSQEPPPGYGPPQPGIVPLRPLDLGDVLGGAFRFVRRQPAVAMVPAAVLMVVLAPLQFAAQAGAAPPPGTFPGFTATITNSVVSAVPLVLVGLVLNPPILAVILSALVPAVLGRRTSLGEAWSTAQPRLGAAYGVYLVLTLAGAVVVGAGVGLAVLVGQAGGGAIGAAVLIVLVAYAVWLWIAVQLNLAMPATVVEGLGVGGSLTRSRSLVRGSWWRIFGSQLVAGLVVGVAAMVVAIPASILAVVVTLSSADTLTSTGTMPTSFYVIMTVAAVILGAVLVPFTLAVVGLLYVDQRIRRERYDLQLGG